MTTAGYTHTTKLEFCFGRVRECCGRCGEPNVELQNRMHQEMVCKACGTVQGRDSRAINKPKWHLASADTPRSSHLADYDLDGIGYTIFAGHDREVGVALRMAGYPDYQVVCTADQAGITAAERAAEAYVLRTGGRFV